MIFFWISIGVVVVLLCVAGWMDLRARRSGRPIRGVDRKASLDASRVRLFNPVGSFLWERCDGATLDQMVAAVCERFAVDEPTARADVDAFLDDLVERGLLRPDGGAP